MQIHEIVVIKVRKERILGKNMWRVQKISSLSIHSSGFEKVKKKDKRCCRPNEGSWVCCLSRWHLDVEHIDKVDGKCAVAPCIMTSLSQLV